MTAHYVLIDRLHSDDLAVCYPSHAAADDAIQRSEFIDELCERDCVDAYVAPTAPSGYTIVYPPEHPDPHPDEALTTISQNILEELDDTGLSAVVGPGQYLHVVHAGQQRAFSLSARMPGRRPQWLWTEESTAAPVRPPAYGAGDFAQATFALHSWATHQSRAQRLHDRNTALQPPGLALAPPPPSVSPGPAL